MTLPAIWVIPATSKLLPATPVEADVAPVGSDAVEAPAGTLIFVRDPDLVRTAHARESGTVVLAFGGAAGEAFAVSPWETRSVANA